MALALVIPLLLWLTAPPVNAVPTPQPGYVFYLGHLGFCSSDSDTQIFVRNATGVTQSVAARMYNDNGTFLERLLSIGAGQTRIAVFNNGEIANGVTNFRHYEVRSSTAQVVPSARCFDSNREYDVHAGQWSMIGPAGGQAEGLATAVAGIDMANTKIDAATTKINATNSTLAAVHNIVANTSNSVANLATQVRGVDTRVVDVRNALNGTNSRIDTANGKLDIANPKLDAANSKLDVANPKLDAANSKLDIANARINNVDARMNSLDARISSLQSKAGNKTRSVCVEGSVRQQTSNRSQTYVKLLSPIPQTVRITYRARSAQWTGNRDLGGLVTLERNVAKELDLNRALPNLYGSESPFPTDVDVSIEVQSEEAVDMTCIVFFSRTIRTVGVVTSSLIEKASQN